MCLCYCRAEQNRESGPDMEGRRHGMACLHGRMLACTELYVYIDPGAGAECRMRIVECAVYVILYVHSTQYTLHSTHARANTHTQTHSHSHSHSQTQTQNPDPYAQPLRCARSINGIQRRSVACKLAIASAVPSGLLDHARGMMSIEYVEKGKVKRMTRDIQPATLLDESVCVQQKNRWVATTMDGQGLDDTTCEQISVAAPSSRLRLYMYSMRPHVQC